MYLKDTLESLTRIGPRTPMGDVLRRFWIPALFEHELSKPGGDPVELRLLGEDLTAACDAPGHVSVTDRYFQEMAPYPAVASGGVVFVYMGPKEFAPQLPVFAWAALPPIKRATSRQIEACNWAYALEKNLRTAYFLPPFYTSASADRGHAHVPIDDTHTLIWSFGANPRLDAEEADAPVDAEAVEEFHHRMISMARDNARGHAPEAATRGEWYARRPFPD